MKPLYHQSRPLRGKLKAIRDHVQRLYSHDHSVSMTEETNKLLRPFHLRVDTFGELCSFLDMPNPISSRELSKISRYARRCSRRYKGGKVDAYYYFDLGHTQWAHLRGVPVKLMVMKIRLWKSWDEESRHFYEGESRYAYDVIQFLALKGLTLKDIEKMPNKPLDF